MKLLDKEYFTDDLKDTNWLGEVVNIDDPLKIGRVKVRVFGKFDDPSLTNDDIPWASPSNNFTGGSLSGGGMYSLPKIGSIVNINFDNGNLYYPEYTFIQKISDELLTEIGDDYQNFHSLLYDTIIGSKIFYSENEEKGLIFDLKGSKLLFKNDNSLDYINPNGDNINLLNNGTLSVLINDTASINITNELSITTKSTLLNTSDKLEISTKNTTLDSSSSVVIKSNSIDLGGNATEPLVLGNKLVSIMAELLSAIMTLTVPTGTGPSLVPINMAQFTSIQGKLSTLLSTQNKTK